MDVSFLAKVLVCDGGTNMCSVRRKLCEETGESELYFKVDNEKVITSLLLYDYIIILYIILYYII